MADFSYTSALPSNLASSRHEKSLGLLTTRFVALLQQAKDGVLDLKAVSLQYSTKNKALNFSALASYIFYIMLFIYP